MIPLLFFFFHLTNSSSSWNGKFGLKIKLYISILSGIVQWLKTQNKLTLSHNYSTNKPGHKPLDEEKRIVWRTKKLPPVLIAQNSTAVKAVVREPTNWNRVSNKNNKSLVFLFCLCERKWTANMTLKFRHKRILETKNFNSILSTRQKLN